ncbi:hypothetical protein TorRG33x02_156460 [Trema orientale]|uniref:Transmembrane protein n=1 Tax=Trema orientale TaxID=63057 RepID=A0A2P5ESR1_TREOI|nr:hypothetical protein TorRG33x02_156460 [Trema orientale]
MRHSSSARGGGGLDKTCISFSFRILCGIFSSGSGTGLQLVLGALGGRYVNSMLLLAPTLWNMALRRRFSGLSFAWSRRSSARLQDVKRCFQTDLDSQTSLYHCRC